MLLGWTVTEQELNGYIQDCCCSTKNMCLQLFCLPRCYSDLCLATDVYIFNVKNDEIFSSVISQTCGETASFCAKLSSKVGILDLLYKKEVFNTFLSLSFMSSNLVTFALIQK